MGDAEQETVVNAAETVEGNSEKKVDVIDPLAGHDGKSIYKPVKKERVRKREPRAGKKIENIHDPFLYRYEGEEINRLVAEEDYQGAWKRWGPYMSERQWGTVREDYSSNGDCWSYFPHDHARSRAYRWGEDGLFGYTDHRNRLCFGVSLWNTKDPILKERLFGLTHEQGNHGEDVKECYYYHDSTPTHSYMKALYKYPQNEYPYEALVDENKSRGQDKKEYEIMDTGIFKGNRHFDVQVEYAKPAPEEMLGIITVTNRGPDDATCHVLPTLWFRNTWSWGKHEQATSKPSIKKTWDGEVLTRHDTLQKMLFFWDVDQEGKSPTVLFTENETNNEKLHGKRNQTEFVKDAFHRYVVNGDKEAINPKERGTKCAAHYILTLKAGESYKIRVKMCPDGDVGEKLFSKEKFDDVFEKRRQEADEFYGTVISEKLTTEEKGVVRQAYANLLWNKQLYSYNVQEWLDGDYEMPLPPNSRESGRNKYWKHVKCHDIISMPDKWEYPWFSACDLAFQVIPLSKIDPLFAKQQLQLLMKEWYMSPNGHMPSNEFDFGEAPPPMHSLGVVSVYKNTSERGNRDKMFLAECFHKMLGTYSWWMNRRDHNGGKIFQGGYMGVDNFGIFGKNQPFSRDMGVLEQFSGTAWMGYFNLNMLNMAMDLAFEDQTYEDMAVKFFEHYIRSVEAINKTDGGFWDEQDGFYYDRLRAKNGYHIYLRIRSVVGLIPFFSIVHLKDEMVKALPKLKERIDYHLKRDPQLQDYMFSAKEDSYNMLLSTTTPSRMKRMLTYLTDEYEFLGPYGIRSLSRYHHRHPFEINHNGESFKVTYMQRESTDESVGKNNNWRGPMWMPLNYLIVEALERYDHFYSKRLTANFPFKSGPKMRMKEIACQLAERCASIFVQDATGRRPVHGQCPTYWDDSNWNCETLFYEYFDAENGRGLGASHQGGWTSLITTLYDRLASLRPKSS